MQRHFLPLMLVVVKWIFLFFPCARPSLALEKKSGIKATNGLLSHLFDQAKCKSEESCHCEAIKQKSRCDCVEGNCVIYIINI